MVGELMESAVWREPAVPRNRTLARGADRSSGGPHDASIIRAAEVNSSPRSEPDVQRAGQARAIHEFLE